MCCVFLRPKMDAAPYMGQPGVLRRFSLMFIYIPHFRLCGIPRRPSIRLTAVYRHLQADSGMLRRGFSPRITGVYVESHHFTRIHVFATLFQLGKRIVKQQLLFYGYSRTANQSIRGYTLASTYSATQHLFVSDNHSDSWWLPCVYRSRRITTPSSLVPPSQASLAARLKRL